eukprot:5314634-Lingulodinium_polyedra.AAC.1
MVDGGRCRLQGVTKGPCCLGAHGGAGRGVEVEALLCELLGVFGGLCQVDCSPQGGGLGPAPLAALEPVVLWGLGAAGFFGGPPVG